MTAEGDVYVCVCVYDSWRLCVCVCMYMTGEGYVCVYVYIWQLKAMCVCVCMYDSWRLSHPAWHGRLYLLHQVRRVQKVTVVQVQPSSKRPARLDRNAFSTQYGALESQIRARLYRMRMRHTWWGCRWCLMWAGRWGCRWCLMWAACNACQQLGQHVNTASEGEGEAAAASLVASRYCISDFLKLKMERILNFVLGDE